jgi:hypothetical protein
VFMLEYMSDDEDRGMQIHLEEEAQKTLDFTLQMFSGVARSRQNLNYGSQF